MSCLITKTKATSGKQSVPDKWTQPNVVRRVVRYPSRIVPEACVCKLGRSSDRWTVVFSPECDRMWAFSLSGLLNSLVQPTCVLKKEMRENRCKNV